jgi:hypothetical protein
VGSLITPRFMSAAQGVYYALTGLWPLLSMQTFLAVTGPKTDLWLVRTVGLLITVEGIVFLLAAWRNQVNASITTLAVGSAVALGWVDAYYSLSGVIWPVYLLDAFGEAGLVLGWALAWWLHSRQSK